MRLSATAINRFMEERCGQQYIGSISAVVVCGEGGCGVWWCVVVCGGVWWCVVVCEVVEFEVVDVHHLIYS